MRVVILILALSALSLNAEAIAVASDHLDGNILELVEGTSKIYRINLQNPESYEIRYKVDYSNDFMKALDFKDEYILPPQSSVTVEFNVTAPKYIKNKDILHISYTVHQLTGGGGGGVSFLTKINKQFKLKVIKDPNRFHINYFYAAYSIVLLAIFFFLYKKRISKRKKRINWRRKFK